MNPSPKRQAQYTSVQNDLIFALNKILKHATKPDEIRLWITALQNVRIPEDEYQTELDTIYLMLRARPDIQKNPEYRSILKVCRYCAIKLGSLKE